MSRKSQKTEIIRQQKIIESILDDIVEAAKDRARRGKFPALTNYSVEDSFRQQVRDAAEAMAAGRGVTIISMLKTFLEELQS